MGCCFVNLTRILPIIVTSSVALTPRNDSFECKKQNLDPYTPEILTYWLSLWILPVNVPRSLITIPEFYLPAVSFLRHAFIFQDFLHPRLHDCPLDHIYAP